MKKFATTWLFFIGLTWLLSRLMSQESAWLISGHRPPLIVYPGIVALSVLQTCAYAYLGAIYFLWLFMKKWR
jgi:hypothetical protein